MKLVVLIDIICDMGKTSKLIKTLKESGLSPKLLSHDGVRLKVNYALDHEKIESTLDNVSKLRRLLANLAGLWKAVCVETWIEGGEEKRVKNNIVELDNGICVHIRLGMGGSMIKKLVLTKQCKWDGGGPIPESLARKCIETPESLDNIFVQVHHFVLSAMAQMHAK